MKICKVGEVLKLEGCNNIQKCLCTSNRVGVSTKKYCVKFPFKKWSIFEKKCISWGGGHGRGAITSTITILIGTLYPLILETITGSKISVGAAYYNATFSPIMIPFIIIMAFAPFLGWKKTPQKSLLRNMLIIFILAFVSSFIIFKFNTTSVFGIICG